MSGEDARRIVDEIKDLDDGVTFEIKEVSNIMDEMEYPGICFTMNAIMGKLAATMMNILVRQSRQSSVV